MIEIESMHIFTLFFFFTFIEVPDCEMYSYIKRAESTGMYMEHILHFVRTVVVSQ